MKKVLVTGANSGIGLSIVKLFLKNQYTVFAHFHTSDHNLKRISSDYLYSFQADFSNSVEVKKLFNYCFEKGGRIDILINNAGVFGISDTIESISESDFDKFIAINVKAPFILSQLVIGGMIKNKFGRIINISSIGVKYGGNPISAMYTITKSALEAMTLTFAKYGASKNVLVNAIRVGVTDTDIHRLNKNKNMDKRIEMIPMKRMALPEEIAETVFFLASEKSSFTTGSILTVAGGE